MAKMENDIFASILLWLHVSGVITFSIGMVASFLISSFASREENVKVIQSLTRLAAKFGRFMDIGGAFMLLAGFSLAGREKEPMLGFLQGSSENWLLISILLFLSTLPVIMGYWSREKATAKELEEAAGNGKITPHLKLALADKRTRNGKLYEILAYALIVFLMTVKPF
jgi:hypothetical protein